jgi:predicted dehydrogenase
MTAPPLRIGLVGAGRNTRERHIPGFRAVEGVEILGIVNSSRESTGRVAREFSIPRTYENWQALLGDKDIDAVCIGTWPNLHCPVTCAALEAGKHVLTEARMAASAAEAHRMLAAAHDHPHLVKQIVPSPFGLAQHGYIKHLIADGFLGDLRELVVVGATETFCDASQPLHWRQDAALSGVNVLTLGILHETAIRWTPPPARVFAQAATFEPDRPKPSPSGARQATVPDSLQVVTQLKNGGRGLYHLSGVARFGPGQQIHLYGSRGTIKIQFAPKERLLIGKTGDEALREVHIPAEQRGGWRVEAEFVGAIRGEETVEFTDFATGVKYMEFTEAVARSAQSNQPVDLPLGDAW